MINFFQSFLQDISTNKQKKAIYYINSIKTMILKQWHNISLASITWSQVFYIYNKFSSF